MATGRISVLLSDDSTIVREGVRALLAREPDIEVVGLASDYDELIQGAERTRPQVLVTDIRMPPTHSREGIEAAREVRRRRPDTGVVILSQYQDPDYALALLREEATGCAYLLKDRVANGDQLARAIREVAAGGSVLDPAIVHAIIEGAGPAEETGGEAPGPSGGRLAAADPGSLVGTTVAGYWIEAVVGKGGMGVVYRAEHVRLKRTVALKLLAPALAGQVSFRERFLRECELAARLEHPNVVTVYDAGELGDVLYIAMRYVDGAALGSLIAAEGCLEPQRALGLVDQVAGALDAAHGCGLVHRDVKPGNILVEAPGSPAERAFLCDFGIGKLAGSARPLTAAGELVGTVDYVAPEQIEGSSVDARTDVYSLGCVLYECLTGMVPFQKDRPMAVLFAHLNEAAPRADDGRDVPRALADAAATAMAKDPDDRFSSCGELVQAARAGLEREGG
jgi:serine/threonine-protein kinase